MSTGGRRALARRRSCAARCQRWQRGALAQSLMALALAVVLITVSGIALAGIVVSLEQEMQRLQQLEALLRDIEAAESDAEVAALTARWEALRDEFERLGRVPDMPEDVRQKEIVNLNDALERLGSDLATLREAVLFPKAANRVAVFTFDDPGALGIGDAISFLVAKHLLFSTRTRSFAVVNFQQGAAPERRGGPAYFDKVDKLTAGQGYSVALWGRIAKAPSGASVEMFGQAFSSLDPARYRHELVLPRAMGGDRLVAALTHDRFALSTVALPAETVARLREIADAVRTLRASPSVRAAKVGVLAEDAPYFIAASEGDWVQLQVRGGASGWTSVRAFCTGPCARLLPAVDFANEIVAAGAGQSPRAPAPELDADARYVHRELVALHALASKPAEAARISADYAQLGARGAGLAAIHLLARAALALGPASAEAYSTRTLDEGQIEAGLQMLETTLAYYPNAEWARRNFALLNAYQGEPQRRHFAFMGGRRAALVIGNSEYERLPALKYAYADATRMQQALQDNGYDVRLLVNANRATIRRAIEEDRPATIFFAGHALAADGAIYLAAVDTDPRQARLEAIELDTLAGTGRRTTVMIDAQLPEGVPEPYAARLAELGIDLLWDGSQATPDVVDIGAGVFAFLLSQSIGAEAADSDRDGFVSLTELATHMNDTAAQYSLPLTAKASAR